MLLQVRKQAEDAVKQLSNRPEVIPQLVQQLQSAADPQVRQLSAVLLRKWIVRHWDKLPAEVRGQEDGIPFCSGRGCSSCTVGPCSTAIVCCWAILGAAWALYRWHCSGRMQID